MRVRGSTEETVLVGAVVVTAAAIRVYHLMYESFWIDEAITHWFATNYSFWALITRLPIDQPHLPLYYLTLKTAYSVPYVSGETGRILSALFGILLIPAVYYTVRYVSGKYPAFISAVITTIAPLQIYYSQELRMYSLLALLVVASYYFLLRWWYERDGRWLAIYGFLAVLFVWTHYYGLLYLSAQLATIWLLARLTSDSVPVRVTATQTLIAAPPAAVLLLKIILPLDVAGGMAQVGHTSLLSAGEWAFTVFQKTFMYLPYHGGFNAVNIAFPTLVAVLTTYSLAKKLDEEEAVIYGSLFIVPVAGATAATYTVKPILMTRYLIVSAVALYVILSISLVRLERREVRVALATFFFLAMAIQSFALLNSHQKPGMHEADEYISSFYDDGDVVLVDRTSRKSPILYYFNGGEYDTLFIPAHNYNNGRNYDVAIGPVTSNARQYDSIFFVTFTSPKDVRYQTMNRLCDSHRVVDVKRFSLVQVYHMEPRGGHREAYVYHAPSGECRLP